MREEERTPSSGPSAPTAAVEQQNPGREVVDAARDAFDRRLPASSLLELVSDSLMDGSGGPEDHVMRFSGPGAEVTVRVRGPQGARSLEVGTDLPAGTSVVPEHADEGAARAPVVGLDASGAAVLTGLPAGSLRLLLTPPGAGSVHTDWFRI